MTKCFRRILIALNVVLICGLVPTGALNAWVYDPFCIFMTTVRPIDVKLTGYHKAKVQSGKWLIELRTPSPACLALPQVSTGPASVSLSHVTVTKGGGTKTSTRVNVPGLKIVQKTKWKSNKSKVRIKLIIKRGSKTKTRTFWRTPHP